MYLESKGIEKVDVIRKAIWLFNFFKDATLATLKKAKGKSGTFFEIYITK